MSCSLSRAGGGGEGVLEGRGERAASGCVLCSLPGGEVGGSPAEFCSPRLSCSIPRGCSFLGSSPGPGCWVPPVCEAPLLR